MTLQNRFIEIPPFLHLQDGTESVRTRSSRQIVLPGDLFTHDNAHAHGRAALKTFSFKIDPLTGEEDYEVYLRGRQLLNDPFLDKGSAFTLEERLALDLDGRLPAAVSTMEAQLEKSLESFRRKQDDLEKYLFQSSLLDRSEPLFYRLLVENLTKMVPIVYTPTAGLACQRLCRETPHGLHRNESSGLEKGIAEKSWAFPSDDVSASNVS